MAAVSWTGSMLSCSTPMLNGIVMMALAPIAGFRRSDFCFVSVSNPKV
jgi:hypothetical protein